MNKTGIIATIGPASLGEEVLSAMKTAGMSMARINTAHGDLKQYTDIVQKLRRLGGVPIMIDLKGPELRVVAANDLPLVAGGTFVLGCEPGTYPLSLTHNICPLVKVGTAILFDGGTIRTRVQEVGERELRLAVEVGGTLKNHKGVNVPELTLPFDFVPDLDRRLILWSAEMGVEYLALSFVRTASDVSAVRKISKPGTQIIAKLENRAALDNLEAIMAASDGVMIARGDLGVEAPLEEIPILEHAILKKTNAAKKMDIVATQMLLSMVNSPLPTRAEVSDIAHAVWEGADYVMLSEETAQGKYPVEAVSTMHQIVAAAEHGLETHQIVAEL